MRSPFGRLKQFATSLINTQRVDSHVNHKKVNLSAKQPDELEEAITQPDSSFINESLRFNQHGFLLNGACKVSADIHCVLVATIGEQILGMTSLSRISSSASPILQNDVHFSMQLDSSLLIEKISNEVTFTLFSKTTELIVTLPCANFLLSAIHQPLPVQKVAPSYGFFGGGKLEPLVIQVDSVISSITISIAQSQTILNLREIQLFDSQAKRIVIDQNIEISCSSLKDKDTPFNNILNGHGFHSETEDNPWLTVRFVQPVNIARVAVINRGDQWGSRSQRIKVSVTNDTQQKRLVCERFSNPALASFYAEAITYIGLDSLLLDDENQRRKVLLVNLFKYMQQNIINLDKDSMLFSLQFLSIWAKAPPTDELLQIELKILGIYIFHSTKKNLKFSLLPFSRVLSSKADLEFLECAINAHRTEHGIGALTLTKHSLAPQESVTQNISNGLK